MRPAGPKQGTTMSKCQYAAATNNDIAILKQNLHLEESSCWSLSQLLLRFWLLVFRLSTACWPWNCRNKFKESLRDDLVVIDQTTRTVLATKTASEGWSYILTFSTCSSLESACPESRLLCCADSTSQVSRQVLSTFKCCRIMTALSTHLER